MTTNIKPAIPSVYEWSKHLPAHDADFKVYFGLPPTAKWPKEGVNNADGSTKDVWVNGSLGKVHLWVNPTLPRPPLALGPDSLAKRHRLQCQCPKCGAVMSAGRLQQHAKIHQGV